MEAAAARLFQRAGGCWKPVQKRCLSTSGVSDESHGVVSHSIRIERSQQGKQILEMSICVKKKEQ